MPELLGFFSLRQTHEGNGFLGAILVTDNKGIPQEFRVTHPIKPTLIQKQLYGASLHEYIGVTLCGAPLYTSLKSKPKLMIVSHKDFLNLASEIDSYVVYIHDTERDLVVRGPNVVELNQFNSDSETHKIRVVAFPNNLDSDGQKNALDFLNKFSSSVDLVEPFDRIKTALEVLSQQDERFR